MSVKPFSPKDAEVSKVSFIPDEVIEAVNTLLSQRYNDRSITIKLREVVAQAQKNFSYKSTDGIPPDANVFYENKWLDIEPIFSAAGWKVTLDKPGYNENYVAYFIFEPKTE